MLKNKFSDSLWGVLALSMLTACGSSNTTTTVTTENVSTESTVVTLVNNKMTTATVGKSQASWTITSKSSDEQLVYKAVLTDASLLSQASTIAEVKAAGGLIGVANNKNGKIYDAGAVTEICIKKAGDDNEDLANLIISYMSAAHKLAESNGDTEDVYDVSCIENISVFTITPSNTIVNVAIDGNDVVDEYWYVVLTACDEPDPVTVTPTIEDNKYSAVTQ